MKIFQGYEKCLAFAFVRPELKKQCRHPTFIAMAFNLIPKNINLKTLRFYCLGISSGILLVLFSFFDARTFQEYSETAYGVASVTFVVVGMMQFESRQVELFKLIDDTGNIIEERK